MPSKPINNSFFKVSNLEKIVIIVSIVCVIRLGSTRRPQSSEKKVALIYHQSTLLDKVDMEKDKILTILNGRMQVQIKNGKLKVTQADCPQHLCMHMGWIQHSGQTIACVPNKILIEVKSDGESMFDAVSF